MAGAAYNNNNNNTLPGAVYNSHNTLAGAEPQEPRHPASSCQQHRRRGQHRAGGHWSTYFWQIFAFFSSFSLFHIFKICNYFFTNITFPGVRQWVQLPLPILADMFKLSGPTHLPRHRANVSFSKHVSLSGCVSFGKSVSFFQECKCLPIQIFASFLNMNRNITCIFNEKDFDEVTDCIYDCSFSWY